MAGRPHGEQPRDHLIQIRVTKDERAALDTQRGAQTISNYVRRLIFKDSA